MIRTAAFLSSKIHLQKTMKYNINQINEKYSFNICGLSYIRRPVSNTAIYISEKDVRFIENLKNVSECLIFTGNKIAVPGYLSDKNCFNISDDPNSEYLKFVRKLVEISEDHEKVRRYRQTADGVYLGENVVIADNAHIEPGVLIGHDVVIGQNAVIMSGAVIKNARIGNNVLINERAAVGTDSFTMTEDEHGNTLRLPAFGNVIIGDNVEIGAQDSISRGLAESTFIEDNVKLDALVYIGHDTHICSNAKIAGGAGIGSYNEIGENSYIGLNAVTHDHIIIGKDSYIGMGAVVITKVDDDEAVIGVNAKHISKPAYRPGRQIF